MKGLKKELDIIRGYAETDDGKIYISEAERYDIVFNSIIMVLKVLAERKYNVGYDMGILIYNMKIHTFGPMIRDDIAKALDMLQAKSETSIFFEIAQVKEAHYGREMREYLYTALVKLGGLEDLQTEGFILGKSILGFDGL